MLIKCQYQQLIDDINSYNFWHQQLELLISTIRTIKVYCHQNIITSMVQRNT